MTLSALLALAVLTVISVDIVASQPPPVSQYTYMVVSPRNIRPATELVVPILFARPVINEQVTLTLSRKVHEGLTTREDMYIEKTVNVANGANRVDIKNIMTPANITWGSYFLNVSASGSIAFSNSSSVYGRPKAHAIFVQTDKKKYKHGDTVQYRVFMVNADLDLRAPAFTVEIFDPNGNKIDELANKDKLFGISGTHELSDPAALGSWKITVKIPEYDETETQIFEVDEYVLPKFEVTVMLPSSGHVSDTELKGVVKATYTFGQPVKGTLTVTASRQYGSSFFDPVGIRKEMPIDGTADFTFSMKYLTRLTRYIQHDTIVIDASVTETITGIRLDGKAQIRFYEDSHSVTFYPNLPDNFKSGVNPYKAVVKVAQQDGRPPQAPVGDLKVTVTYFTDATPSMFTPPSDCNSCTLISPFKLGEVIAKNTTMHTIGADGLATFYLTIPPTAATATIKAEYKDTAAWKDLRRFRTIGEHLLKVELLDGNIRKFKIGDTATFRITVTEKPGLVINYVILSRGQIVESGHIDLLNLQEGNIQQTITRSMAPSARFVAFYVKSTGEVLAAGLNFVVEQPFENKVAISFDKMSPQEPKTNVTLTVTAAPNSMVNILGIDKSVMLLASGNDITQQRVIDELGGFGDNPFFPRRGWFDLIPSWPIAADDPYDVFSNAQLNVFTDGDLYKFDLWSLERQQAVMSKSSPQVGMRMQSAAFSADSANGGMGGGAAPVGQVRKFFPETWLWESKDAAGAGVATFQSKMPDTITEYVVSAFALDVKTGLGVAATTANMTTFLPFFVKLQLPYDVVRGEVAVIQVNVFNYLDKTQDVTVKLFRSDKFVGIKPGDYGTEVEDAGDLIKCVTVKMNEVKPVFFSIKPTKIGSLDLKVRASIPPPTNRFDEIVQPLRVKAEGLEKEDSVSTLIVLTQQTPLANEVVPIKYPADLVPDSARIQVTLYGDLLGPSLTNLDKLIRIPSGCGEQNMVHFAPTIFVSEYMRATGRLDNNAKLLARITRILKIGYQRQLIYQRNDGSFSAFGNADDEGSLWLTAFVVKSFAQAHRLGLILIDPEVVGKAVQFISDNQRIDGLMNNVGIVSHKVLQGQSASSIYALSSYVLIALYETERAGIVKKPETLLTLHSTITKLTDGLKRHYETVQLTQAGAYELAIAAYALKLVHKDVPGRPTLHLTLLRELENSTILVKEGNLPQFWNDSSKAISLEITSYALLLYTAIKDKQSLDKSSSVVKWLVKQRNPHGGFLSTQDTVVALQALSSFAALTYTKDANLNIDVSTVTNNIESAKENRMVNVQNQDVLQVVDIPNGVVDEVKIAATGTGTVLVGVHQFFNIKSESTQAYSLSVVVEEETNNKYKLKVCASFTVASSTTSNMAIIDVGSPSGFEPVKEMVEMVPLLKRLEMSSGRLILYFDEIPKTGLCIYVPVQRTARVANLKPASVLAYSYYDPTAERVLVEYSLKQRSLCQTCVDCCSPSQECKKATPVAG